MYLAAVCDRGNALFKLVQYPEPAHGGIFKGGLYHCLPIWFWDVEHPPVVRFIIAPSQ